MARARTVADVILGEAVSGTPEQRYRDMKAIASAIMNRAQALGVTPDQVVANSREFNAYNRSLPPGVEAYRSLADQALLDVQTNGPVHKGTFYATPSAAGNLPSGLLPEAQTTGHIYYSDPKNRAIGTSLGYRQPRPYETASQAIEGLLSGETKPATINERMGILDASPPQEETQMAQNTLPTRSVKTVSYFQPEPQVSLDTLRQPTPGLLSLADQYASYGAGKVAPQQAGLLSEDVAYQRMIDGLNAQKQSLQAGVDPMASIPNWTQQQPQQQPQTQVQAQEVAQVEAPEMVSQPIAQQPVSQPAQQFSGGLLSPQEQEQLAAQRAVLSQQPTNKQKSGLGKGVAGALGGGLLGGLMLGPLGGLLGAALGKSAMNGRINTMLTGYPTAPSRAGSTGNTGKISRGQLNESGRNAYNSSEQFRDAVDRGSVGLY